MDQGRTYAGASGYAHAFVTAEGTEMSDLKEGYEWLQDSLDKTIAFQSHIEMPQVPGWYRRTYILAIAFGPLIAGIAGLFDRDCSVWVWSENEGFRPVVLTKRN